MNAGESEMSAWPRCSMAFFKSLEMMPPTMVPLRMSERVAEEFQAQHYYSVTFLAS